MHIPYVSHGHVVKDVQRKCLCGLKSFKPMIHFDSKQSQSIFNQNYYENAMANDCKQCFNTHYQSHCHPTTKSLWLCSSVYCGPPHQSRRIWLAANPKPSQLARFCNRNVHTCAHFCYKIVHCGIWDWYIVGLLRQVCWPSEDTICVSGIVHHWFKWWLVSWASIH